jgi:hypothetical protein
LLGIQKHSTGEKSVEYPHGRRYWEIPHDVALHLARIGFDAGTLICTDWSKLALAIREFDAAKESRYAKEDAQLDLEARKESLRKAMQTHRRTTVANTATPSQVLETFHLNNRIAKEIIRAQGEEEERGSLQQSGPRPGHKLYRAVDDDYLGDSLKMHE